jgi:hypothetical protein
VKDISRWSILPIFRILSRSPESTYTLALGTVRGYIKAEQKATRKNLFGDAELRIAITPRREMIAAVWLTIRLARPSIKLLALTLLIDPMSLGCYSHLITRPSAFTAYGKQAAVRIFEVSFAGGNSGRERFATSRAFEQEHMNKRINIVIHNLSP